MPKTRNDDLVELLRLAITSLDTQLAVLQERRAQLAVLINDQPTGSAMRAAATRNRRKLSAAARAKISAAQKARWAKKRESKAQKQKTKPAAKTVQLKAKPAKAQTGAKKSPAKKR